MTNSSLNEKSVLSLYTISTAQDELKYTETLHEFENHSVLYSLEYFNKCNPNEQLCYFIYKVNGIAKILMPIYLNKIKNSFLNTDIDYYDAISPYGYSGPLLNHAAEDHLKHFWEKVDEWYKKNNIVTEFIRFNLDNNHINYSGHLIKSLNNVKGEIKPFDELWNNFKQKVRNNYRKAEKNNLSLKVYREHINTKIITSFYDIYIKTMHRNEASNNYFYTIDYFKKLIKNNSGKILIAVVYKEDTAISSELIIDNNNRLYSFLGGTLSEYFNLRPNDYLKIEVIKWAINQNKTYYTLGGGRHDNDGLYQYKKAFFPKDNDVIFYTGRKIINTKVYNNILSQIDVNYTEINLIDNKDTYFPIYKQIKTTNNNKTSLPSKMEIITNKTDWKNTLDLVENSDFYHSYDYHMLSKAPEEEAVLIKYTEADKIIALPLIIRKIENTDYYDATSVYGYSGPLQKNINLDFNNNDFINNFETFLQSKKIISVFSRLNPFIKNQDIILHSMGNVQALGNIVNIDLTKPLDEQRAIYGKSTKSRVNKIRKKCDIIVSENKEDIDKFIAIYIENMDRVNAKSSYYFPKDYFYNLINSSDYKIDLLFALHKETNEYISASMMVKTNNIIQYHLSGTKNDFLNLSPVRAIIDEMRIIGTKEGYTFFNLGGGLGNEEDELFKFKSSFSKDFKTFKVWKFISNKEIYDKLTEQKNLKQDVNIDFFPLYRYED